MKLFFTIATILIGNHALAQKVYSVEYASQAKWGKKEKIHLFY